MHVATADQENCFTYVLTPRWMWAWFCAPSLPHWAFGGPSVTGRWDVPLNARLHPAYRRLPLGCSHSVDLVMAINNHAVFRALSSSKALHERAVWRSGPLTMLALPRNGRVCWEIFSGAHVWTDTLVKRGWGAITPVDTLDSAALDVTDPCFLERLVRVLGSKLADEVHL